MPNDGIMKYENILPEDFDGQFYFTNWTDEDFVGKWGGKMYTFPAKSRSPMVMPEHSPLEIQQIRKKFAKDLAEAQFFASEKYNHLLKQERNPDGTPRLNSLLQAGTYNGNDLNDFIQKCLQPLEVKRATAKKMDLPNIQDSLSRNDSGELNTEVVDPKTSLKQKALQA